MIINGLSQIKVGATIKYFSIAFSIIAGLLYTPWMITQIGQSEYGLYTLSNSIISLFLVDFGLSTATSKFVSKYKVANDAKKLNDFLGTIYKLYLIIDILILLILIVIYLMLGQIYVNLSSEELEKLKVIYCITGVYSLVSFPCVTFNGILTSYERFIPLQMAELVQKVGVVFFTVLALLKGNGLYALVLVNAIMGIVSIVIKYYYVRRLTKVTFYKGKKDTYKEIFNFSIWSTIWSLSQRLIFNITPTIIGVTVKKAASSIAVFGIITTIEGYVFVITTAINGMFISRVTKLTQKNDDNELNALLLKVGRFQFALNGLIVVGFALVGKTFIILWMGEAFIDAYYGVMLIILPGLLYNSLQIANTALITKDLIKYPAIIQVIIGICNLILSLLLSYFWGVVGASISIFVAYTIRLFLILIIIKNKLEVDLKVFIYQCYFKMAIPMIVCFICCWLIGLFIEYNTWYGLFKYCFIILVMYSVLIVFLGLSKKERGYVKKKIVKKY